MHNIYIYYYTKKNKKYFLTFNIIDTIYTIYTNYQ